MDLASLGWNAALASACPPALSPGRVVRQESRWLRVATEGDSLLLARPSARLEQSYATHLSAPVVGDWVGVRQPAVPGERALIEAVLPRRGGLLVRRGRDDGRVGQALAANVDQVLLVVGLDRALNDRWLERALTLVHDSGARPLVVVNKGDLEGDGPDREHVRVSAKTGAGLEALLTLLRSGETTVMLGSSGVGKSSLVNALLGESAFATGDVRAQDKRGRHTTTHRELVVLPQGALLLDTPGIRELGLWIGDEGLARTFPEIASLSAECRFRDCTHEHEPGCAVREAADPERLESYEKLRREQRWIESTHSAEGRASIKRRHKSLTQLAWRASRDKRK